MALLLGRIRILHRAQNYEEYFEVQKCNTYCTCPHSAALPVGAWLSQQLIRHVTRPNWKIPKTDDLISPSCQINPERRAWCWLWTTFVGRSTSVGGNFGGVAHGGAAGALELRWKLTKSFRGRHEDGEQLIVLWTLWNRKAGVVRRRRREGGVFLTKTGETTFLLSE